MRFMNEWDIENAKRRYSEHPILGPATRTLENLMVWTNNNSDGWPYWSKPLAAAARLMEMIERDGTNKYYNDLVREDVTVRDYTKSMASIKAFRTRHKADFEIEELRRGLR